MRNHLTQEADMGNLAAARSRPAVKEITDDDLWPIRNRLTVLRLAIRGLAEEPPTDGKDAYALVDVAQRIEDDLHALTH
jgi:hypothetical protein